MHQAGRLSRLAVDEVHCCSQWGHDFRPDYKFLGAMRSIFPDTPILGLTATSTAAVTKDVKDILRIPSAMVFTTGFNRPNLHYSVRLKPENAEENIKFLVSLVQGKFKDKTGIIYSTTVKEVDTLYKDLKSHGVKVGPYHAQMEAGSRSKVHRLWTKGDIKVVVATVAFGMGIDKPDVRFVIHNTVSRSMENFYQESGRAGRDGALATCIMLWRLGDLFKQSTMVFQERTGIEKLYSMASYCLNTGTCRRRLIAEHFLESMDLDLACDAMCDVCDGTVGQADSQEVDVTDYARAAVDILTAGVSKEQRITAAKLVEALQGRGANIIKIARWKGGQWTKEQVEQIVATMLVEGKLQEDMHYTPYSVISYILPGHRNVSNMKIKFVSSYKNSKKRKKKEMQVSSDEEICTKKANFSIVLSSDDDE